MLKSARLLVLIIVFIPICYAGSFDESSNNMPSGSSQLISGEKIPTYDSLVAENNKLYHEMHEWKKKHSSAGYQITLLKADLVIAQNDVIIEKRKCYELSQKYQQIKSDYSKLKEEHEKDKYNDVVGSICVGGLCAAYAYKHFRSFQDASPYFRIPFELICLAYIGGIPLLYQLKEDGYGYHRFIRGCAWVMAYDCSLKPVKESDPFLFPLLGFIAGPIIMDQVAVRVDRYLDKKKINMLFDITSVVGTIAMVNLAYVPWSKVAALLGEK